MKYLQGVSWRSVIFGVGLIGAVAEAIHIAQKADIQVTPAHIIALGCTAAVTYTMKYRGDITKQEAADREERVRRASQYPPPEDMTAQKFTELARDVRHGKVDLRDEDEP